MKEMKTRDGATIEPSDPMTIEFTPGQRVWWAKRTHGANRIFNGTIIRRGVEYRWIVDVDKSPYLLMSGRESFDGRDIHPVEGSHHLDYLLGLAKAATKYVAKHFANSDTLCYVEDGRITAAVGIYAEGKPISPETDGELKRACTAAGIADCECVRNPEGDLVCYGFMDN